LPPVEVLITACVRAQPGLSGHAPTLRRERKRPICERIRLRARPQQDGRDFNGVFSAMSGDILLRHSRRTRVAGSKTSDAAAL